MPREDKMAAIVDGKINWVSPADPTRTFDLISEHEDMAKFFNEGQWTEKILDGEEKKQSNCLRVVAVSDIHSRSLVSLNLPPGDVLVIAGDLSMYGSEKEFVKLQDDFSKFLVVSDFALKNAKH